MSVPLSVCIKVSIKNIGILSRSKAFASRLFSFLLFLFNSINSKIVRNAVRDDCNSCNKLSSIRALRKNDVFSYVLYISRHKVQLSQGKTNIALFYLNTTAFVYLQIRIFSVFYTMICIQINWLDVSMQFRRSDFANKFSSINIDNISTYQVCFFHLFFS